MLLAVCVEICLGHRTLRTLKPPGGDTSWRGGQGWEKDASSFASSLKSCELLPVEY